MAGMMRLVWRKKVCEIEGFTEQSVDDKGLYPEEPCERTRGSGMGPGVVRLRLTVTSALPIA